MSDLPEILEPAHVGALFGIAEFTVMENVRKAGWPHFRIGRRVLFTADHVGQIVAMNERQPTVTPVADTHGQRTRGARS